MRDWGSTVTKILAALKECGEMTPDEICQHIDIQRDHVSTILTRLRRPGKQVPQRVYVVRYVSDAEGMRRYPRPVYALGRGINAKRPKSDKKEIKRRYNAKVRKLMTTNSVFNLALTRRQYKEMRAS
jgi:predicted ArsR family transcriptional regulator